MSTKKRGFSFGTVFTLCLLAAVAFGCVFFFSKTNTENRDIQMDARTVVGVLGSIISSTQPTQAPSENVRTVTVTRVPQVAITNIPLPDEKTSAETPVPAYSFTMTLGGLLGFQSDISDSVYRVSGNAMQYRPVLSYLSGEINSDLNTAVFPHIVNLNDGTYADIMVPLQVVDAVKAAGFDDLQIGSEHILDQGMQGMENTVSAISEYGISVGGVNMGVAKQNRMVQINSAKIALLSYADSLTSAGQKVLSASANQACMQLFDTDVAREDIARFKAEGANCVIVFLHWGREDAERVTDEQRGIVHMLADAGADIIIGAHTSRVLPVELLETVNDQGERRQVLVAYSLGTLLTESVSPNDTAGVLLHLSIICDATGKVTFQRMEYTPTYIWRQNMNGNVQYHVLPSNHIPPADMETSQEEEMERSYQRINDVMSAGPIKERVQ